MEVVLVMFRADLERRSFSVVRNVTVIGRREDCDLRIPVGEVSRKHCRVIKEGDTLSLEDLGSSNGSYHNGQRVQGTVTLAPGDSIQVGPVTFVVQIDGVPADDALVPFTERAARQLDDSTAAQATADQNLRTSEDSAIELEPTTAADADQLDTNEPSQADQSASDDLIDFDADSTHEPA